MRIINPSFGTPPATAEALKSGAVDWLRDPIVLFSNSKPNARELLEGVKARLGSVRDTSNIGFVFKQSASRPGDPAMIEAISQKYRGALLALGD